MRKIRLRMQRLIKDERGNVAIFSGLCLLPAILFIGGAIDVAFAIKAREKLQAAADSGTLAAASLGPGASDDDRTDMATKIFTANLGTQGLAGVVPQVVIDGARITLQAGVTVQTSFLKIINIATIDVAAQSAASPSYTSTTAAGAKICLLALDPANTDGIHIQGDNRIDYTGCWAHTNSGLATAINSNGSVARAVGAGHCAVGSFVDDHQDFSPTPQGGCATVPDPFARVSAYSASGTYAPTFTPPAIPSSCKSSNLNLKKGSYTLEPGRYCGGIHIQAQANVTLNPGIYIIENGDLNVQSGASLTGSDVLFYFTGDAATMTVIGGGTIDLHGRRSDSSFSGFLFMAKPGASTTQISNIQGGGTFNLEGMLYMPKQTVLVTGNGDVNGSSPMFGMVAKNFDFRGNGIFKLQPPTGSSAVPDIMPTMPTTQVLGTVSLR